MSNSYIDNLNNPVVPVVPPTPITPQDTSFTSYVRASGYVARAYSKVALEPRDVQGAIDDIKSALNSIVSKGESEEALKAVLKGFDNLKGVSVSGSQGIAEVDWAQVVGLLTRAISKLALTPKDIAGATADFFTAVQLLTALGK